MTALTWEKPRSFPALGGEQTIAARATAASLRARPGEWARVRLYTETDGYRTEPRLRAASYAWQTRMGRFAWARPAGTFEAVHSAAEGGWAVYVRFVGEADVRARMPRGGAR